MKIINTIKKSVIYSFTLILLSFSASSILLTSNAYALDCPDTLSSSERSKCEICRGAGGQEFTNGQCDPDSTQKNVGDTITQVINIFSWIVGVAAVIMIMVGGFRYVTSQGDSNNISAAKNTILYAIIGLVVVALSQVIVRFVINKV